jgi:uncharacterized protein
VSETPWYREGLRFTCTGCGDCCTGEPGAVWVNDEEIGRLAAFLGLEPAELEARFVRRLGARKSLFERFDGDCVFFDPESRRCRVYPARPVQCRTWPFWPDNLESEAAWRETEAACPGSGRGELVPLARIRQRLAEHAVAGARGADERGT